MENQAQGNSENAFCPNCGKPISRKAAFCPHCGGATHFGDRFVGTNYSAQQTTGPQQQSTFSSGSAGASFSGAFHPNASASPLEYLTELCGGTVGFVFTIVLTASLLFSIIGNFGVSVIWQIPTIIVCIGCWLAWYSYKEKQFKTTGFSLISGALLASEILAIIEGAILIIFGIITIATAFIAIEIAAGIGLIVGGIAVILLLLFYYIGLRNTALSVRDVISGSGSDLKISMYAIVILCISMGVTLIGLIITPIMGSLATSVLGYAFTGVFSMVFRLGAIRIISTILSLAVSVLALIILFSIRTYNSSRHL